MVTIICDNTVLNFILKSQLSKNALKQQIMKMYDLCEMDEIIINETDIFKSIQFMYSIDIDNKMVYENHFVK